MANNLLRQRMYTSALSGIAGKIEHLQNLIRYLEGRAGILADKQLKNVPLDMGDKY